MDGSYFTNSWGYDVISVIAALVFTTRWTHDYHNSMQYFVFINSYVKVLNRNTHTQQRPFVRDYQGEPVPER